MRIIAFIANSDSANPNNAQIFNAEETDLTVNQGGVSIRSEKAEAEPEVYSVDGNLYIDGSYQSATLYTMTGNTIMNISQPESKLSIASLESGIYLIKLNVGNTSIVRKFLKH